MANIYLIKSDSYNLINTEIEKHIDDTYEVTKFSLLNDSIYDIIDDASYFGFLDGPRAIIVNNVKYFGGKFLYEEESEAIINFAKNNKDTKMFFICDDIKKTKTLTSSLVKLGAEIIDLSLKNEDDLRKAIKDYVNTINIKIEDKAIDLLLSNTVNNIDLVIQEINKISNITNDIKVEDIKKYSFKIANDDIFSFSTAVINKNFEQAFKLLDEFILNGMDIFSIVGVLASSFTNIFIVKDAVNHGLSDEEIAKLLDFKSTGRVYYLKKDGRIYTLDNLKEIIVSLSELDKKIKTGYEPVYSLKEFLLGL